jgi:hypothetical protein
LRDRERLKVLYADLAEHTWSDCEVSCTYRPRYGCCHPMFCRLAAHFAARVWDVELEPTGHPRLPFMGPEGCTIEPHLRPVCSKHTCERSPLPFRERRQLSEWHRRYEDLMAEVERLDPDDG